MSRVVDCGAGSGLSSDHATAGASVPVKRALGALLSALAVAPSPSLALVDDVLSGSIGRLVAVDAVDPAVYCAAAPHAPVAAGGWRSFERTEAGADLLADADEEAAAPVSVATTTSASASANATASAGGHTLASASASATLSFPLGAHVASGSALGTVRVHTHAAATVEFLRSDDFLCILPRLLASVATAVMAGSRHAATAVDSSDAIKHRVLLLAAAVLRIAACGSTTRLHAFDVAGGVSVLPVLLTAARCSPQALAVVCDLASACTWNNTLRHAAFRAAGGMAALSLALWLPDGPAAGASRDVASPGAFLAVALPQVCALLHGVSIYLDDCRRDFGQQGGIMALRRLICALEAALSPSGLGNDGSATDGAAMAELAAPGLVAALTSSRASAAASTGAAVLTTAQRRVALQAVCWATAEALRRETTSQTRWRTLGGVRACSALVAAVKSDAECAEAACAALTYTMDLHMEARTAFIACGGVAPLVDTLRVHVDKHEGVTEHALMVSLRGDGAAMLLMFWPAHLTSMCLLCCAFCCLQACRYAMFQCKPAQDAFGVAGLAEHVCRALLVHREKAAVMEACFGGLKQFCLHSANPERFRAAGGLRLLIAALETHQANRRVVEQAGRAAW